MNTKERQELYHKVFDTAEGKEVLDDLYKQHYLNQTTYTGDNVPYDVVYKEGQRSVVLRIIRTLKNKETE